MARTHSEEKGKVIAEINHNLPKVDARMAKERVQQVAGRLVAAR
jgi:hypothetical protein